jgi:phosphatidylserine/phosphatidylglycerophosphate/cardiolipin synthase-like enzyme
MLLIAMMGLLFRGARLGTCYLHQFKNMIESIIGREFADKVIPLINNAKHTIKIIIFDWRWYPNDPASQVQLFNQSVVRAVARGVVVSVIGNNTDILQTLKSVGCLAKNLSTKNLVHAKMILIDDKILVVGSHNFSQQAFTMNYEVSVILSGDFDISTFSNFFNNLWNP